jgi:hypothetical protein
VQKKKIIDTACVILERFIFTIKTFKERGKCPAKKLIVYHGEGMLEKKLPHHTKSNPCSHAILIPVRKVVRSLSSIERIKTHFAFLHVSSCFNFIS